MRKIKEDVEKYLKTTQYYKIPKQIRKKKEEVPSK
jgi:hypothetical protein